jgi:hypothetical protein
MTVETLGTIEPLSTVQVGCETTGKIVEILVDYDEPGHLPNRSRVGRCSARPIGRGTGARTQ